jgi:uncharacterized protein with HEPN domain
MSDRTYWRLTDMKTAITDIRQTLSGKDFASLGNDKVTRAAFERFLEVLSEASRHVPQEWKDEHPEIPWRKVADLGNHVRHAYHRLDLQILWDVYAYELKALEDVVDRLIQKAAPQ